MKRIKLGVLFATTAAFVLSDGVAPAFAQFDEIMVTARKREESLMDVPVSMQTFTAADIERYAVSDLTELSEMASQVMLYPAGSGSGAAFVVRGISSTTLDPGVNMSVTINMDGMQISRGRIVRQAMFDMETVEILKGPQALFFGKNSPAGVVSINSAGPTEEFEGKASLFYEFVADELIGEAVVSGPVTDEIGFRLAYQGTTSKGYLKNVSAPAPAQPAITPLEPFDFPGALDSRKGGIDQHIGRLTLEMNPNDNFSATLKVLGSTMKNDGSALNDVFACSGASPITLGGALVDPTGDCDLDTTISTGAMPSEIQQSFQGISDRKDGDSFSNYDSVLATLNMDWNWDNFSLTSVTGMHWYDWVRFDNFDGTTYDQLLGMQDEQSTTWSQELRLLSQYDGPLNFMLGAFYENVDRDSDNRGKIAPVGADPITGNTNNWQGFSNVKGDSWSIFGQAIWDITPDLELAGGLRWSKEDKKAVTGLDYVHLFLGAIFLPAGEVLNPKFSDEEISPEATLTWSVNDNLTVYGAYKTGYKAGGFSTQTIISPTDTNDIITYDAESADGGELGLKSILLDGRMNFNMTVYKYTFDGIQDSVFSAATTSFQIRNADSQTKGFDFDAMFHATDNLTLRANAGYNEAKYRSFTDAPCWTGQTVDEGCVDSGGSAGFVQDLSGKTRPFAPKLSASFGVSWNQPVASGMSIGLTGDVIYTDSHQTQAARNPVSGQDSNTRFNASARLYSDDGRWEVALIGRNLSNEIYLAGSADKPGGVRGDVFGTIMRPRQLAIQTSMRF